jgi:folate-binding protein YgfZ
MTTVDVVPVPAQLGALERGAAFAGLPGWRAIAVEGADARPWLHDLVTADVAGLRDGQSRRSLLLTPTGRIRADVHVARVGDGFLLLQDPTQAAIDELLSPYVLSSDVALTDRSAELVVVAVLGRGAAEDGHDDDDVAVLTPSVLGAGRDLVLPAGDPFERARGRLVAAGAVEVGPEALETWRIRRATPRMGADFGSDALPAEVGLESTIDFTKGCFLGQESVAKVRNLGHPPRLLRAVRSGTSLRRGALVLADGHAVGEITSAATDDRGAVGIARVRWEAASLALSTEAGPLSLRSER